ncbi:MAG: flagellar basal body P-ring protein FlgI [Sphingobacteriia bacterium]|nr:flagellar basal body P-ring protein FlgI [Sphingobacteriia bacterium]
MKKPVLTLIIRIILITCINAKISYASEARIKDIVNVEGIRENLLIGYGLVVGLNGTGDNLNNSAFTQKGLVDFLERLGINTRGANLKTKNIAAVTVTAVLPPFARQGSRIDVQVSTLGDAKSLQDGTLLATPLLGADGQVYAVSQGQVSIGGFDGKDKEGAKITRSVTTNATIINGAIIEREIPFRLESLDSIKLALHNPDLTTALQIAEAVNIANREDIAKAIDPGTVEVFIPVNHKKEIVRFLADIEQLVVYPDQAAKIVIDEASGTVVMGQTVRISPIAISQGNLTVIIKSQKNIENPEVDLRGENIAEDKPVADNAKKGNQMVVLPEGTTLGELVDALNSLGVGPRDLITILQTIKSAGALQSNIELR